MTEHFICSVCGGQHLGLFTDWGAKLPDAVWALPEAERAEKAQFDSDLCQLGERYFIRGVLGIPFKEATGRFGWGVWAEVKLQVFQRYLETYDKDGNLEPVQQGKLANSLLPYKDYLGASIEIKFRGPTTRPSFYLSREDQSQLAVERRSGIPTARYHQIMSCLRPH